MKEKAPVKEAKEPKPFKEPKEKQPRQPKEKPFKERPVKEKPAKEKLFRRRRTMVKKPAEGNISFVTGTAGYLLAGEVVRDILSAGNVSHS